MPKVDSVVPTQMPKVVERCQKLLRDAKRWQQQQLSRLDEPRRQMHQQAKVDRNSEMKNRQQLKENLRTTTLHKFAAVPRRARI